jgi:hypothetical protein
VGTTPFSLSVARVGDTPASVELTFSLDGYQGTTMVAQGLNGTVPVRPTLTKKKTVAPVKPKTPRTPKTPKETDPGYKDDPYR